MPLSNVEEHVDRQSGTIRLLETKNNSKAVNHNSKLINYSVDNVYVILHCQKESLRIQIEE